MVELTHTIGGRAEVGRGEPLDFIDPSTGETWSTAHEATPEQVSRAVEASSIAASEWRFSTREDRRTALSSLGAMLDNHRTELAEMEVTAVGKTYPEVQRQIDGILGQVQAFDGALDQLPGPADETADGVVWEARGPVASFLPWNGPLNTALRRTAVTLTTGGSLVLKASEVSPGAAPALAEMLQEVAIPNGLVSLVIGRGSTTGAALLDHEGIAQVALSGSVPTGRLLAQRSASLLRPAVLELGGKSAQVVLDDADIASTAEAIVKGFTRNAGQVCTAATRLLASAAVVDTLVDAVVERTSRLRVGTAHDPETEVGPLISAKHRADVHKMVGDHATSRPLTGGQPIDGAGFLYQPTVIPSVADSDPLFVEEVFGPVLAITTFHTDDMAVQLANATQFGMGAAVWSRDVDRARALALQLDVGVCWINDYWRFDPGWSWVPRRSSGTGPMDFGMEGLKAFLQPKRIVGG